MAEPIRFHPQIVRDLQDAIGWYASISPALGDRFREEVDTGFVRILDNPFLYPIVFDDVRFLRVRSFPYLILYRVLHDIPCALGVFHGASNPGKWRARAEP